MQDTDRPENPRYEHDFSVPEWKNFSDPATWGQQGAVFYNVMGDERDGGAGHSGHYVYEGIGHGGGGGRGGGHGGGRGGPLPFIYDTGYGDQWPYPYDDLKHATAYRSRYPGVMMGQTATGMSAALVIGLVWLAYEVLGKATR
jgi:hypothetical protein